MLQGHVSVAEAQVRRPSRRAATRTINRVRKALRRNDCETAYDLFRYADIGLDFESVSDAARRQIRQQIKACGVRTGQPFTFLRGGRA